MSTAIIGDNPGGGTTGAIVDCELSQQYPGSPQNGTSNNIKAATSGQISRSCMRFDLSVITGPVDVSAASLSLFYADNAGATRTVEVRKLLSSFVDSQATWNYRTSLAAWNVAGALGGTDVDATVIATGVAPGTLNTRFTVAGASFTQLVEDWINGVVTNNGVILSVLDDTTTFDSVLRRVASNTNSVAANRPTLTITYTPVAPPSASGADVLCTKHDGTTTITVTLSEAAPVGGCSVDYATQDSTAIAGQHYTTKSGTLTFAQGEQSKSEVLTIAP